MKMEALLPPDTHAEMCAALHGSAANHAINIIRTFFLRGPSIWTYRPVLEAWVDIGDLEDRPSNTLPGLYERLSTWLPGLIEHRCSPGVRGGFLMRLREGTWAGHILEHVAIELQVLAGIPAGFGQARETSTRGIYKVVVRTPSEEIGCTALYAARDLLLAAIDDRAFDIGAAVAQVRRVARKYRSDMNTACLLEAAAERRIPAITLDAGGLVQLGYGKRQRRIWMNKVPQGSAIAQGIADDRLLARNLLKACGIPVPYMEEVKSAKEAWEMRQDSDGPLIVKPRDARCGNGVLRPADTQEQIEIAFLVASQKDEDIVAEQFVSGEDYRLLVVGNEVVAVVRQEIVGELRRTQDVSDRVHADVKALACQAARVIGLEIAEVNIVAADITRPLAACQGRVVAVKALPDLQRYGNDEQAAPLAVGCAIIDHLFAGSRAEPLPIVTVSGSPNRTRVAHLVAQLLQGEQCRVGMACGDGLYLGTRQLEHGDRTDWQATQRVLRNPTVDAAVFEHRWSNILAEGLGYERCKVSIVTGLDNDDLVPEYDINNAEQMRKVTRTPVDVVLPDGAAVLNANDPAVAALAEFCDGEVIFYSRTARAAALAEHRERGGRAIFARGGEMVFATGPHTVAIAMGMEQATPQATEAMLAAAAAAWALDLPIRTLCSTLKAMDAHPRAAMPLAMDYE